MDEVGPGGIGPGGHRVNIIAGSVKCPAFECFLALLGYNIYIIIIGRLQAID